MICLTVSNPARLESSPLPCIMDHRDGDGPRLLFTEKIVIPVEGDVKLTRFFEEMKAILRSLFGLAHRQPGSHDKRRLDPAVAGVSEFPDKGNLKSKPANRDSQPGNLKSQPGTCDFPVREFEKSIRNM
jgi:hypothetical protein